MRRMRLKDLLSGVTLMYPFHIVTRRGKTVGCREECVP